MAILKSFETEFLSPEEKAKDTIVTILTEPAPNPKFKSPAVCEVSLENGEKRLFSFNKSTIKECKIQWGSESLTWVGKDLVSQGEVKLGNMNGYLWTPKQRAYDEMIKENPNLRGSYYRPGSVKKS